MARSGPTSLVHWMGGYDLAGPGAITEIDEYTESETTDVTPLGPMGAIMHDAPIGRVMYSLTETGYLQERQASLRRLIRVGAAAYPWTSIVAQQGGHVGALATVAVDLRVKRSHLRPDTKDITKIDIEYYLNEGGELHEDVPVLFAGLGMARTNGPEPLAAWRYDQGSDHDRGGSLIVMCDVDNSRFRGWPELSLNVVQYDGTSFSDAFAAATVERDDGPYSRTVEVASGTTLERYLALHWALGGTRDSFLLRGRHAADATSIEVDGGTGLERIEAGDMLDIGGIPRTALSATEDTNNAGRWTVQLNSALGAIANDDAVVALTGANIELRLAAAYISA